MLKKLLVVSAASALLVTGTGGVSEAAPSVRHFANCTALNKVYPHGVGRVGAHDHTSGTPVTSFKRSNAIYNGNTGRDRDKDKIACEKR